jgi:hypothetical protein
MRRVKKGDRVEWTDHQGRHQTGTVVRTFRKGGLAGTVFVQIDGRPDGHYANLRATSAKKEIKP